MFKNSKSFSSFSVDSIENAKKFYEEILGLEVSEDTEMGMLHLHLATGAEIMVYAKPNHVPASYTILNFIVDNIEQCVDELTNKGVQFEHYDGDIKTDAKGIARGKAVGKGPNIAWFKDPAGNFIAVIEK